MTPRARKVALAALLALGLSSITGSAIETVAPGPGKVVAGFGKLSLASPHPKVFCRVGGEEAFGFEHTVELRYPSGAVVRIPFDRKTLARVEGPYAYKNGNRSGVVPSAPYATAQVYSVAEEKTSVLSSAILASWIS